MTEIVLVRHAATTWSGIRYSGRSDPPLSDAGRAEAVRLGAELAPLIVTGTLLISSPSIRALETAKAIASAAGIDHVETDDRWLEADVGVAEGRTFDEVAEHAPALAKALAGGTLEIDWPGGEKHLALAGRVADAWTELTGRHRPVIVVTHAGPLMHALALAEGRPPRSNDLLAPAAYVRVRLAGEGQTSATVLPSRA
ncbi:MAG TPA: histidine phosphatase family protein [Candidatus Limnocylindrales bacterium]|nr:histidine phosphatase family protein [Candidatus Limnocylindrales bacterium]